MERDIIRMTFSMAAVLRKSYERVNSDKKREISSNAAAIMQKIMVILEVVELIWILDKF